MSTMSPNMCPPCLRTKQEDLVDELFKFLGGEETQDVEVMFVIAVMGEVVAWCLGEDDREFSAVIKLFFGVGSARVD